MAFIYPSFDVRVERNLNSEDLSWPAPGEAIDDRGLGGNRLYIDFRRLPWNEAHRVYAVEGNCIKRIVGAMHPEKEYEMIEREFEDGDSIGIFGLDIGVASTVIALSSARCVPCSSCNAGAFGGYHNEEYPLVVFYARTEMRILLLECAEAAGTGLENTEFGHVIVYADDIRMMRVFAEAIIERRSAFRQLIFLKGKRSQLENYLSDKKQLKLI